MKGASVVGQGGVKDKRSKGVGGREVLIQLGRGDEKNNNNKEEVAKKRTTVNESLAGGDRIQTLDATQGIGNRKHVRSSAKKAVGWYLVRGVAGIPFPSFSVLLGWNPFSHYYTQILCFTQSHWHTPVMAVDL